MTKLDEQIAKVNEQIKQLNNKKKTLLSKQNEEKRKQRAHRLIERGAILEKAIGNAETLSNEQIQAFLIDVFSSESARAKIENLRSNTEREG